MKEPNSPEPISYLVSVCRESTLDAWHYWERMRLPYNLALATISLACWGGEIFSGRAVDFVAGVVVLMFFATAANLCYCAAYPFDIAFQLTPWRRYRNCARWILFAGGMSLASACALYLLLGDPMA